MEVSKRCAAMQFSPIRRFNVLAFEAEREHGKKVYRLNIGQPDIETQSEISTRRSSHMLSPRVSMNCATQ